MATNYLDTFGGDGRSSGGGASYLLARVDKVVYGPYLSDGKTLDPDYKDLTSIGAIRYTIINSSQYQPATGYGNELAKPMSSVIHYFPAVGEYVHLIYGPSLNLNEQAGALSLYYHQPINLWGACNHNALPPLDSYAAYINSQREISYEDAEKGLTQTNDTASMTYPIGIVEKGDIKNLRKLPGDLIIEGRYGHSIRFGSTIKNEKSTITWANSDQDGDPIIMIRNGQGIQTTSDGFDLAVENINTDQSSIYLTAGQQIVIDDISNNFPLTSWNVSLSSTTTTVVATMTVAPTANETFSAQEQDNSTLPTATAPTTSDITQPSAELTEEQLKAYDQDYINFYSNWTTNTGRVDDGYDAYYHYKTDNLPKLTRQVSEWRVSTAGYPDVFTKYSISEYPTTESIYKQNPKLQQKVEQGTKVITRYDGPATTDDTDAKKGWATLTAKLVVRNRDKIKHL